MDAMLAKLGQRDRQVFDRVVVALKNHDTSGSRVLSAELSEIRKVSRTLSNARMSLEQVQLRLSTIHDLGDAMIALGPAMSTMKGLKSSLGKFMPEADSELSSMTQTLNGLMVDSISGDAFSMESEVSNAETESILQEANAVAEQQADQQFPSVPTSEGFQSQSSSSSTFE
jgi:division protein CdvB (Snf7/Vps24/ESCRT-III family)